MSQAPTSFDAVLKEDYSGQALEQLLYQDYPFLKMLRKRRNTEFGGKYHPVPVNYTPAGGTSGDFATAQNQGGVNQDSAVSFFIPAVQFYTNTQIPGQIVAASRNSSLAFMDVVTKRMDDSISLISTRMASQVWRGGYGVLGTVGAISGNTITLANPSDVVNFPTFATFLDASATISGATRSRGSSITGTGMQVTAVDQSLGTISFVGTPTSATTGLPGLSVGDYLFGAGDHATAGGAQNFQVMVGLEGLCPVTAPLPGTGDMFYGVDRSVSRQLTGTSYAAQSGVPIDQVLIRALNKATQNVEAKLSHFFMNLDWYTELENSLGTKVRYGEKALIENPTFGALEGIVLNHPRGQVLCVADKSVPGNRIFGVNEEDCMLYMMNDGFEPWDGDGLSMLRMAGADALEIRFNGYQNFFVNKPNNLISIQVPLLG